MNEYLPKIYQKDATIEADIVKQWKPLVGMEELNAKYRYVQLCRSLKTYGITCFEVQLGETRSKDPEIKKLMKRKLSLGVTRDAIMILDSATKVFPKRKNQNENNNK